MVQTDGIATISNYVVAGEPVAVELKDEDALLEREHSGLRVSLHYFANRPVLRVRDQDGEHSIIVEREQALDAFRHPYAYLAR